MTPYRETVDRLGNADREEAAVQAFGRWSGRTKTIVLLVFCTAGAIGGIGGFVGVSALQMRMIHVSWMYPSVFVGFGVPFVGLALIGRRVARVVVHRRTGAEIARLAALHQIDPAVLHDTARAVEAL